MTPIAVARRTETTVLICEARPTPMVVRASAKAVMRRVTRLTVQISAQVNIRTTSSEGRSCWTKPCRLKANPGQSAEELMRGFRGPSESIEHKFTVIFPVGAAARLFPIISLCKVFRQAAPPLAGRHRFSLPGPAGGRFPRRQRAGPEPDAFPFPPPTPQQNGGRPPFGQRAGYKLRIPALHHAQEEAAKRRNIDRQNKLKANSDTDCATGDGTQHCGRAERRRRRLASDGQEGEEIEKLAHSVKELMKSE